MRHAEPTIGPAVSSPEPHGATRKPSPRRPGQEAGDPMNASDEQTSSVWTNVEVAPDAPALAGDERADAVVVGSGIAGLSIAYELRLQGLDVVVLDRGAIAGGMTARTTAHLASTSDDGFETVIKARGLDGAKN